MSDLPHIPEPDPTLTAKQHRENSLRWLEANKPAAPVKRGPGRPRKIKTPAEELAELDRLMEKRPAHRPITRPMPGSDGYPLPYAGMTTLELKLALYQSTDPVERAKIEKCQNHRRKFPQVDKHLRNG